MIATVTSKGRITIPLPLRKRLNLKAGDRLDFDESSHVLTARRIADLDDWMKISGEWQDSARASLRGHAWEHQSSATVLDDMRGTPAETPSTQP